MAKLDWSQVKITQNVAGPYPRVKAPFEWEMVLEMDVSLLAGLVSFLEGVYQQNQGELRVDLPQRWVKFWKKRDFDSRSLIAHPSLDEWILTLALTEDFGNQVIVALKKMGAGETFVLSQCGKLSQQSNAEWVIKT